MILSQGRFREVSERGSWRLNRREGEAPAEPRSEVGSSISVRDGTLKRPLGLFNLMEPIPPQHCEVR